METCLMWPNKNEEILTIILTRWISTEWRLSKISTVFKYSRNSYYLLRPLYRTNIEDVQY